MSADVRSQQRPAQKKDFKMDNPPDWDRYLRLQTKLDAKPQINNRSWGLEAGLDAILAAAGNAALVDSKVIAAGERRERYRAGLRRTYSSDLEPAVDQPAAVE